MCGISGLISINNKPVSIFDLKKITDIISYRGPDDEGFYTSGNIGFGHRRLSILDLSKDGHQPMHYLDKYVITYNGEIYNYVELKEQLRKVGYVFNSKTDTEVILAAYDYWGEACTHQFNGMWAFAIHDKVKNIVFCSRDRFGVKPFYYTLVGDFFAFGSEIKQFTVLPAWKAAMNTPRAIDFLTHGIFDHTNETLFENVYQLKGGHNLLYNLETNQFEIQRWYDLKTKLKNNSQSLEEAKSSFFTLFQDAVRLRLRSDVKVGSCLSGGLDSSSIVCVVNKILRENNQHSIQETVSSCFEIKKFDEQEYIDEVVNYTDVKAHKVFPKYENLFDNLEKIIWHQDEPIGSSSVFAHYYVFDETTKNKIKVMLDGQGADEILAGYDGFYYSYYQSLLSNFNLIKFSTEISSAIKYRRVKLKYFIKKNVNYFLPNPLSSYIKRKFNHSSYNGIKLNSKYKKNDLLIHNKLYYSNLQELSLSQVQEHSLPMLLHNADRMSMAHSVESRLPFLDYRLVEYVLSLPDCLKIYKGKTKFILRESLMNILPAKITNRFDKMGFLTPEAYWMQNHKKEFYSKLTTSLDYLSEIVDKEEVLNNFNKDVEKGISMGSFYWRVISLATWMKAFQIELK